jgi:type II secretory pathway pseudopilin PulG
MLAQRGFTLMQTIFAIVMLAILVRFAMIKLVTPGTLTLPAQALAAADTIRRAQTLAMSRGQRMSVVPTTGSNGSIAVNSCPASGACATQIASVSMGQGVSIGGGAPTIYFNTLGQPVSAGSGGTLATSDSSYTVSYTTGSSTQTFTITVAAGTGRVFVTP